MSVDLGTKPSYIVARAGDLIRGEVMNVAVFAWDRSGPDSQSANPRLLQNWSRWCAAFERTYLKSKYILEHLESLRTVADVRKAIATWGPYSGIEFTEERPTVGKSAEVIADWARDTFLVEY